MRHHCRSSYLNDASVFPERGSCLIAHLFATLSKANPDEWQWRRDCSDHRLGLVQEIRSSTQYVPDMPLGKGQKSKRRKEDAFLIPTYLHLAWSIEAVCFGRMFSLLFGLRDSDEWKWRHVSPFSEGFGSWKRAWRDLEFLSTMVVCTKLLCKSTCIGWTHPYCLRELWVLA